MSFAFSRPIITDIFDKKFHGEWKYLRKTVYEVGEMRADRALLEMAVQLRALDDEDGINDYLKETGRSTIGTVVQGDGTKTDLHFRDMTNKILHAAEFQWRLWDPNNPRIACIPSDKYKARWQEAEIRLIDLMALIGGFMH